MGSFQVLSTVGMARPKLEATLLCGGPLYYISTTSVGDASANEFYVDFSGLRWKLDARLADSRGKTNLINPAFTSVNDGDLTTYNQGTTTATSYTDVVVKLDMGVVDTYLVLIKASTVNINTTHYLQIVASPDDATYTSLASSSAGAGYTNWLRCAVLARGYRYFKTQAYALISSITTVYVYELAIYRVIIP
jgi:hypothetical protein